MANLIFDEGEWDNYEWAFQGDLDATLYYMLDHLPHWWNKTGRSSPGSNTFEILRAYAIDMSLYSDEIRNMKNEVFVDTSTGTYLDDLGKFYLLLRKTNETDAQFRGRIKSYRSTFSGGGTKEAIENSILQEFGATCVVTDNVGSSWCKAKVTMSTTEWISYIAGSEDAYYNLIANVKAAGIYLGTNLVTDNPVFTEINYLGEIFRIEAGQVFTETFSGTADDLKFAVQLNILGGLDLVWDEDEWDWYNWWSEIFEPVETVRFDVQTHWEETMSQTEFFVAGANLSPLDIQSQLDLLTFLIFKDIDETNTLSEDIGITASINIPLDTQSQTEYLEQSLFLNIPSTISHNEILALAVQTTLPLDTQSQTEDIDLLFNLIWEPVGPSGQESEWDSGAWS